MNQLRIIILLCPRVCQISEGFSLRKGVSFTEIVWISDCFLHNVTVTDKTSLSCCGLHHRGEVGLRFWELCAATASATWLLRTHSTDSMQKNKPILPQHVCVVQYQHNQGRQYSIMYTVHTVSIAD